MGQIFYIADTHFGHENIIKYDNRPFKNADEMNEVIINNWNRVVGDNDMVYILGDFAWKSPELWTDILKRLKGNKVLIKGNHDLKSFSPEIRQYFQDIKDYKEVKDSGRRVILCHYPMPFYRSDYNDNIYHLFGHIHITPENDLLEEFRKYILEVDDRENGKAKCQWYNLWCGFYDYTPVTLDQVIERWKERDT